MDNKKIYLEKLEKIREHVQNFDLKMACIESRELEELEKEWKKKSTLTIE